MSLPLTLQEAQKVILENVTAIQSEQIPLAKSLGRIPRENLLSLSPKPDFDQSTRDGFVIGPLEQKQLSGPGLSFQLCGEIAAGSWTNRMLEPGQAMRITTGAMIPSGGVRVVQFEDCHERDGILTVPTPIFMAREQFVRSKGSDFQKNVILVKKGKVISPDDFLLLTENGHTDFEVFGVPKVSLLCTGSELVSPGANVIKGKKVSGNSVYLSMLLEGLGAQCSRLALVPDEETMITQALEEELDRKPAMIITTGGMGPGKYDLVERTFRKHGGQILYSKLMLRPGKATLFGLLKGIPFFALPGPPPAVKLLFHELIVPALKKMMGYQNFELRRVKALLSHEIKVQKSDFMYLKGAVITTDEERLVIRVAKKEESINSILYLPGTKYTYKYASVVSAHLVTPLF